MNIQRDKAERHCQALAEIHALGRGRFMREEIEGPMDGTTAMILHNLWDSTIAVVFAGYFTAIDATPAERAELGL